MICPLCICCKIGIKVIGKEKKFEYGKHDKEFYQDDPPEFSAPGHLPEALIIESEKILEHESKMFNN